jgi:hypothetical protein
MRQVAWGFGFSLLTATSAHLYDEFGESRLFTLFNFNPNLLRFVLSPHDSASRPLGLTRAGSVGGGVVNTFRMHGVGTLGSKFSNWV